MRKTCMQKLENFRIICQLVLDHHNSINGTPKFDVIPFFLFLFCVGVLVIVEVD
jgi:hypothetical protein